MMIKNIFKLFFPVSITILQLFYLYLLIYLAANGNFKPTDQLIQVKNELTLKIDDKINEWLSIKNNDLKKLNSDILNSKIDIISIK